MAADWLAERFHRMRRLPPYIFAEVTEQMMAARRAGEDIINLGMGNPDGATPPHIVERLIEAARQPKNHRYSLTRGIPGLRAEIARWYSDRYRVEIDPEAEAMVTIGSKEGIAHLVLACIGPEDVVFVPNPTYPIHIYSIGIAGGIIRSVPIGPGRDFFHDLMEATATTWPRPKALIVSFPHNPTTAMVDLAFFERLVDWARDSRVMLIHDFAYADLVFEGAAPSLMQVPGAKDVGVEFFSLSKSYNMPGWRVGFAVGNRQMIAALARMKSYFDYGNFAPIQVAAVIALRSDPEVVRAIVETYRSRRDALCDGFNRIGWPVERPSGTMFVWAAVPERFRAEGSLEFCKRLVREARVAASPGVGFGDFGEGNVRFALVENEERIRQAVRGIKRMIEAPCPSRDKP